MKSRVFTLGFILLAACLVASAPAEDKGWKLPNLNPFSSKTSAASPPTSGWKMPKLWPKTATAKKKRTAAPSALSKMSKSTQGFISKTADAINPWDDKPEPAPKITGSNSIFTQQRQAAKKKEAGSGSVMPASWWGGDKGDSKPKSVNDFLSQPRP